MVEGTASVARKICVYPRSSAVRISFGGLAGGCGIMPAERSIRLFGADVELPDRHYEDERTTRVYPPHAWRVYAD